MNTPFYNLLWGQNNAPPSETPDISARDTKELREGLGGVEGILDSAQKISQRFQPKKDDDTSTLDNLNKYEDLRQKLGGGQMPIGQQMKDFANGVESLKTITGGGDNKDNSRPWLLDEEGELHRADDGSGKFTLDEALKYRREIKAEKNDTNGKSGATPYLVDDEGNLHKADDGSGIYTLAAALDVRKQIREELMGREVEARKQMRPFLVDGEGNIHRDPNNDGDFNYREALEQQKRVLDEKKNQGGDEFTYLDPESNEWKTWKKGDPPIVLDRNKNPSVYQLPSITDGSGKPISFNSKEEMNTYLDGMKAVDGMNQDKEAHQKKMETLEELKNNMGNLAQGARKGLNGLRKGSGESENTEPEQQKATYNCDECGATNTIEATQRSFTCESCGVVNDLVPQDEQGEQ